MKLKMNANDYKAIEKVPRMKQTQQETQTDSEHTQVMLCVESEFIENGRMFRCNSPTKIHYFKI